MSAPPVRTSPQRTPRSARAGRANVRTTHALWEILFERTAYEPTILVRDDLAHEKRTTGPFVGRVYYAWMAHEDGGGCARDPITDPHEDLAYVGKTRRALAVRWAEHLLPERTDDEGRLVRNNSAVYRNRAKLTGWSADPRPYASADELAAAELRAIKALWPAWNIQDQDRRNPHTRATRRFRRPDRLAPLIGLASALWALVAALVTAVATTIVWAVVTTAWGVLHAIFGAGLAVPWWIHQAAFVVGLAIGLASTRGGMTRHSRQLARRERARGIKNRRNRT